MTPELCAVEAHGESRRTGDPQRGPHAGRAASRRREELVNLTWLREGGPRPRKTRPPFYETSREGTTRGTEAAGSCLGRREAGTDSLETSGWWVRGMHRAARFQTSANCPGRGTCLNLNKEGPGLYTPCASHQPSVLQQRWEDGAQRTLPWPLCTSLLAWLCYHGHERNSARP